MRNFSSFGLSGDARRLILGSSEGMGHVALTLEGAKLRVEIFDDAEDCITDDTISVAPFGHLEIASFDNQGVTVALPSLSGELDVAVNSEGILITGRGLDNSQSLEVYAYWNEMACQPYTPEPLEMAG